MPTVPPNDLLSQVFVVLHERYMYIALPHRALEFQIYI